LTADEAVNAGHLRICDARPALTAGDTSIKERASTEQPMESAQSTRVLIVANRTASTPRLIEKVGRRARANPCEFALLIPDVTNRRTLDTAQRSLRPAARGKIAGLVGGPDPFESVKEAVGDGNFDEIISTMSKKTSK